MSNLLSIRKFIAIFMAIVLTLVILLSPAESATAPENRVAPSGKTFAAPRQKQGPTDPAELESFLDDLLPKEMAQYHIAGAAISVVKDGKLFFAKGYGYADLERKIPVNPQQTIFRIGSVTKLFTWTGVMQLAEQGKLNLDADINTYLDFRIPATYPQPITLKHLMTHTAGFEDRSADFVTLKEEDLVPQREWLISHIPARVRPPGDVPAYSNYGTALAGYIVARVSGESYSQYVQKHILNPLGMTSSTAEWPTPLDLRSHESVGYTYDKDAFKVFPRLLTHVDLYPIGIVGATVTDMAHFMIAHLENGLYSDANIAGARILRETAAKQMHGTLYTPDPRLLGTTYGFFDFTDNGQRTIGHSGTAEPMHSLLLLLPDQNLGVFVSYNSMGADVLTRQHFGFQRAFFDHYYPTPAVEPVPPPADFAQRADRFVGAYKMTQSSYTTLEKYMSLVGPKVQVKNPGDGTLLMATPYGDWRLVEVEPLYFRQVDGPFHMLFREDGQGHITYLFTDLTPMFAFEKLSWYELTSFNMALLSVSMLMLLSMIPVALIRGMRNRLNGDRKPASRGAHVANWLILGICILNLLFVVGNVLWGEQIAFGITLPYKIVLGLGIVSAMLTVSALAYAVLTWKNRYWGIAGRLHYTLVTVAAVAFVWFLNYWNLLGWRF